MFCLFKNNSSSLKTIIFAPTDECRNVVEAFLKRNRIEIREPNPDGLSPEPQVIETETPTDGGGARSVISRENPRERQSGTTKLIASDAQLAALRAAALAIDGAVLVACYIFVSVIGFLFFIFLAEDVLAGDLFIILFLVYMGLFYVLWILYFVVPTMLFRQSGGKWLVGIRIIQADGGTQPSFLRLLIRESLKLLSITSMIGIALNGLEITWFGITWYDRICGTIVVEIPRGSMPILDQQS